MHGYTSMATLNITLIYNGNPSENSPITFLVMVILSVLLVNVDYLSQWVLKWCLPDGSLGNCDRTHQEGVTYTRATESPTYERYEVLKETDCSNCRFWNICYGGCPSEGDNSDWRNKTRWCKPTYDLYSVIEADIRALFPNINLVTDYHRRRKLLL